MRFTKYLWMGLLMAAMPAVLLGASNLWTRMGPDGASIYQIAIDPAAEAGAYVLTNGAGVFKTADAGATWRSASGGLPVSTLTALLVVADDPPTLYAAANTAGGSAIYMSLDGGEHWSLKGSLGKLDGVFSLAFDSTSRILYAATYVDGVFRSLDGGKTWEQPSDTLRSGNVEALAVSPNGTVYVARKPFIYPQPTGTLFRSRDHGATWTAVAAPLGAETVAVDRESSAVYVAVGANVFISKNDGTSWSSPTPVNLNSFVNSIVPVGAGRIYVSTNKGVFEYNDGSDVWTAVSNGMLGAYVHSLAISTTTPRRLYVAKSFGLMTSVENTWNWTAADKGLPAYATDVAVEQSAPQVIYVGTGLGLFKSADDDRGWQLVEAGVINHVALSPDAHDTVYATGSIWKTIDDLTPSTVKTVDGGATWTTIKADVASALAVAPSDSATIYAALSSAMSKSKDGGTTWASISAGLPSSEYYSYYSIFETAAVAVDPKDPARVYVGELTGGIFGSVNGGSTWTSITPNTAYALAIDPSAPMVIYAGLKGGVIKSMDGGLTWASDGLNGEFVTTLAIDPTNSTVYAGTAAGSVHRSLNGGADWTFFDLGLPRAYINKLSMSASGSRLYAATNAGLFEYDRDDSYLQSATRYNITLLTYSKNFVSATDCGDSSVNSNAVSAGPCETFTLYDVNGGTLMDGDAVYLQAANGSFVSADNGGANGCGGCASSLNANRAVARVWETFTIGRMSGPGPVSDGDAITLQSSGGNYVTAENGGGNGCSCDAPVTATRSLARAWETFVVSIH